MDQVSAHLGHAMITNLLWAWELSFISWLEEDSCDGVPGIADVIGATMGVVWGIAVTPAKLL